MTSQLTRPAAAQRAPARSPLGDLPEWDLSDLYPALDSPLVARDLERADAECEAFETAYKDRLASLAAAAEAGAELAAAIKRYETIDDLLGRLISYASLLYSADTSDPIRAKFYGDVQERITAASTHLLFFTLELNRIDDALLDRAMQDPALAHYRPWIEDVRKEKPYQLDDKLEQLFHEKSVTGYAAWNRLFDETMTGLRFAVGGESLTVEQTLNLLQDQDGRKREAAARALAETFRANLRLFSLITNTLAKDKDISDRWRGFADIADDQCALRQQGAGGKNPDPAEAFGNQQPAIRQHGEVGWRFESIGHDLRADAWHRRRPAPHGSR